MTSPSPSSSSREPVAKAGAVAGLVSAVLALLGLAARALGWVSDDVDVIAVATRASDVVLGGFALWSTAAPVVLAMRARAKVTPLGDPRDAFGRVLAAVDEAGPLVDEVRRYLDELTGHAIDTITAAAAEVTPVLPALEDPATTALLGPSVYDQLTAEHEGTVATAVLPAVPAPVTDTPPAAPMAAAPAA